MTAMASLDTEQEDGRLRSNVQFFDSLVSLVPPRYYHGHNGDSFNVKFMKRDARAAAKLLMKAQGKANKRAKLDPDAKPGPPSNAPLHRLVGESGSDDSEDEEGDDDGGSDDDSEGGGDGRDVSHQQAGPSKATAVAASAMTLAAANASGVLSVTRSLTREELLQKLHSKMDAMRGVRESKKEDRGLKGVKKGKVDKTAGKKGKQQAAAKAKQPAAAAAKPPPPGVAGKPVTNGQSAPTAGPAAARPSQPPNGKHDKAAAQPGGTAATKAKAAAAAAPSEDAGEFKFGRVEVGTAVIGTHAGKQKQRKLSTATLLKQAEEKRMAKDERPPAEVLHTTWDAALKRARGEKVLDDPKLLRRTLKKEEQAAKKKAQAWKQRGAALASEQQQRQQKRTDNLQARVTTKLDAKKAKREKKLLNVGRKGAGGPSAAVKAGAAKAVAKSAPTAKA